jgi:predicted acyltransferase
LGTVSGAERSVDDVVGPVRAGEAAGGRIGSVDALRGLTIALMVFVNDLGPSAPSWLHHIQPPDADGMTLADVVFPAFLFIVGVSIPLAIERAVEAGRSAWALLGHVLTRTAGLLFMGVVELNAGDDRTLGEPLWEVLAFTALLMAWCAVPREPVGAQRLAIAVKGLGALALIALLAVFRGEPHATEIAFRGPVEGWVWLRTGWWGILGLIGWAYLTVATLTLLLGRRREWLMGALAVLMGVHLAFQNGGLFTRLDLEHKPWLGASTRLIGALARGVDRAGEYVGLGDATGSLAAVAMAGCLLGMVLRRDSDVSTPRARLYWASMFTAGLVVAGFVTDTFEGVNKIAATPTWCFWSAALACSAWSLLYLLTDVAGLRAATALFRAAGTNPLVAYFLHPIVVGLISLAGLDDALLGYKSAAPSEAVAGSLVMALAVAASAGLLARLGVRIRL